MNEDLMEVLSKEVPRSIRDIRVNLNVLLITLESTKEEVAFRILEHIKDAKPECSKNLIDKIRELQDISDKLKIYIEFIDSLTDNMNTEVEEDFCEIREGENDAKTEMEFEFTGCNYKKMSLRDKNFTYKKPCAIKIFNDVIPVYNWKRLLVQTANYLARLDVELMRKFVEIPEVNGNNRAYFSANKDLIKGVPCKIEGADIYMETKFTASYSVQLIKNMLLQYNIRLKDYEIYLKDD